jgi:transcription elongation factor GreA-like protein
MYLPLWGRITRAMFEFFGILEKLSEVAIGNVKFSVTLAQLHEKIPNEYVCNMFNKVNINPVQISKCGNP